MVAGDFPFKVFNHDETDCVHELLSKSKSDVDFTDRGSPARMWGAYVLSISGLVLL